MAATVTEIARASDSGAAATVTATVGDITPFTDGHIVVVFATSDNETLDAGDLTDTDTLTWQLDHQRTQGANVSVYVFSAEITSGSVDDGHQFTASNNGINASQRILIVYHVAGLASTTWLDEIGANGANSQTVLTATLGASTTEDATLVFGAGCIVSDASLGWTPDGTDGDVVDGSSNRSLVTSWHSETAAGTHSEGGTADASGNYAFVVVAYIEVAGGAPAPVPRHAAANLSDFGVL